jgi:ABC-2 type transport system permease protein
MKKALLPVIVFAKIAIRRAFRDKTALFFIFLFPLIFLFVFGGIFGKNSDVSFKVALINQANTDFSRQFSKQLSENKLFKVSTDVTSLDAAKQKMTRGQIDAAIVLPEGFGAQNGQYPSGQAIVHYTQNSRDAAQAVTSVLDSTFQGINTDLTHAATPLTVRSEQLNERSLSSFDYVFAGLLGFSMVGLGIFGPANVFPELKKQGILRRLRTTPLRVWQYFMANVISQTVVGLISMVLMFTVGIGVFHLHLVGNIVELLVWLILGIVMILGIGLSVGGWAKNERQSAPLANLVAFPMLFLSGAFFPRFLMPHWLQSVSGFLPLTPIVDGVRLIATEGQHLVNLLPQLGLMLGWIVIIYLLAFRVFRWE